MCFVTHFCLFSIFAKINDIFFLFDPRNLIIDLQKVMKKNIQGIECIDRVSSANIKRKDPKYFPF
jgi:hypothetical protein